jgi:ribokinase
MDLVVRSQSLPIAGQTTMARSLAEVSGGKGANQAVAAARLGGQVSMIGNVGTDGFADTLIGSLNQQGVDTSAIGRHNGPSGVAIVAVDDNGENQILVVPGANAELTTEQIHNNQFLIANSEIAVAQLEVPVEAVIAFLQTAKSRGVPTLLNPAPMPCSFDSRLYEVDLFVPNETEAAALLGRKLDTRDAALDAAKAIRQRGPRCVLITLGNRGAVLSDQTGERWIAPFEVRAVDTTAAGDAFVGALAVVWSQFGSIDSAAQYAAAAGAITATRHGAQTSLPTSAEVNHLWKKE